MTTHLWLSMGDGTIEDPHGERIISSDHAWHESDFPPQRHHGDPTVRQFRETDVEDTEWAAMLSGVYSPEEQDIIHHLWWDGAAT